MATLQHELPIELFRRYPSDLIELLQPYLKLSSSLVLETEDSSFRSLTPTEIRADLVISVRESKDGPLLLALIVEIQRDRDHDKPYTWPSYAASLYQRMRCGVDLVVLCTKEETAHWARRPSPGFVRDCFQPIVLGPENIPKVIDPAKVEKQPLLALLSAVFHRDSPEILEIAQAAFRGIIKVPDLKTQKICVDMLLSLLQHIPSINPEEFMIALQEYQYKSDFALRYIAQGREEGRDEGRDEGLAQGKQDSILVVLQHRQIVLSEAQEQQLRACKDIATLDRLLNQAFEIASPDELFTATK